MPDDRQSTRVVCEGGLDSGKNHLFLSSNKPGSATALVNYEVGLEGGYRRISGYEYLDEDFPEVEETPGQCDGKVLGIAIFRDTIDNSSHIIAARKFAASATYGFFEYESGTGWVELVTGFTRNYTAGSNVVRKIRHDIGNDGSNNYICFVDNINEAILYDGTTWTEIDSGNTGADYANAGGNQAIDAPHYVSFFGGCLWLAHDHASDRCGILAHSAPNAFYDFTTASGGGQVLAGLEVVQIKPFREELFVFGNNAIQKVINDSGDFLIRDVTKNLGCIASDSVVEVGGNLYFWAPDGIRSIAGTERIGDVNLATVSKAIHGKLKKHLTDEDLLDVNSVVIRDKSQFRLFIGGNTFEAIDSRGFIGALRTADDMTGWEFGELLGFRASCATSRYSGNIEYVLHGDYDGCVYRQEMGNDFNGTAVFAQYATPFLDMGDTEVRKVLEKITIFFKGEGTLDLSLALEFDWGNPEIITPANYTIEVSSNPAIYGPEYEYGDGSVYGGILQPYKVTNVAGSCFSVRFNFTSSGSDFPYSIHGLVIEYHVAGRR
jgi:hypothetical protein